MSDIIVTSPKTQMAEAAREAAECIAYGGGRYWHHTGKLNLDRVKPGDKIFYVENGFIRGFAIITEVWNSERYGIVISDATTWRWIKPVPMPGFRGWRYFDASGTLVVGDWLDPKPDEAKQLLEAR